jgi:hypothetical protein
MNKPRLIDEYWEPIKGYEKYRISNYGRVANNETGLLLKPYKQSKWGHAQVGLYHDGKVKKFLVHVLVAKAFVPNPDNKPEVCHIDNTIDENGFLNNSASNLTWGTHKENCAYENTRKRQSENHANVSGANNPNYGKHLASEHKEKMMIERGKAVLQWENDIPIALYLSLKEAGRQTGISWSNIRNVCNGEYKTAGGYEWSYACKPYDIDKVVEQLEKLKEWGYVELMPCEVDELIDKSIEIVKGGAE